MGNIYASNPYFTVYHFVNTVGLLTYPVYRTSHNNIAGETLGTVLTVAI